MARLTSGAGCSFRPNWFFAAFYLSDRPNSSHVRFLQSYGVCISFRSSKLADFIRSNPCILAVIRSRFLMAPQRSISPTSLFSINVFPINGHPKSQAWIMKKAGPIILAYSKPTSLASLFGATGRRSLLSEKIKNPEIAKQIVRFVEIKFKTNISRHGKELVARKAQPDWTTMLKEQSERSTVRTVAQRRCVAEDRRTVVGALMFSSSLSSKKPSSPSSSSSSKRKRNIHHVEALREEKNISGRATPPVLWTKKEPAGEAVAASARSSEGQGRQLGKGKEVDRGERDFS